MNSAAETPITPPTHRDELTAHAASNLLRFKTYLLIAIIVAINPLGNVLLGAGMKHIGAPASYAPVPLFQFFFRAMSSATIWLGIGALLLFFVAYMLVLSWADYSFVQPTSSIACLTVALLGHFALHERVTPIRWVGIAVVCLGVFVVGRTTPRTTEHRP